MRYKGGSGRRRGIYFMVCLCRGRSVPRDSLALECSCLIPSCLVWPLLTVFICLVLYRRGCEIMILSRAISWEDRGGNTQEGRQTDRNRITGSPGDYLGRRQKGEKG